MWKFYKEVIRSAIREFWTATDDVLTGIAILSFLLILFNRKYGEHLVAEWSGISPWWSVIPIGLIVLYRLLRANYESFARVQQALSGARAELSGDDNLSEYDPKVYLDPINQEFAPSGIIPFLISNRGQRVNVAHRITVQPIRSAPSVMFDYVDHLNHNESRRLLPKIKDGPLDHNNILTPLEQTRENGNVEVLPFDIDITYEDVSGKRKFKTTVKFEYSPTDQMDAIVSAMKDPRVTYDILRVTDTIIRRLGS